MNRQIVLASRPDGLPTPANFALVETEIPRAGPNQFVIEHHYLGLAPAARIRMGVSRSYAPPLAIGDVIYGQALGRVHESRHPDFKEGALVVSTDAGWQDYSLSDGRRAVEVDIELAPPTVWLGALGVSGMTAYAGLCDVGQVKAGETVVVAAASGAVGSVVGQIAKAKGCRTIGIAGGEKKCAYVVAELGLDACIDYRESDFPARLEKACRDGVDLYFDNVGGRVRDATWPLMKTFGRVVVCGLISGLDATGPSMGPDWFSLLTKRLTVRGFLLRDYEARYADYTSELGAWYRQGRIKVREHVSDDLPAAPAAFIEMLRGDNFGKTLVKLKRG